LATLFEKILKHQLVQLRREIPQIFDFLIKYLYNVHTMALVSCSTLLAASEMAKYSNIQSVMRIVTLSIHLTLVLLFVLRKCLSTQSLA
jgi:hypothetical protein